MSSFRMAASAAALFALSVGVAEARDQVQVSGSSTVLPYATIVAELFGENFGFPTPVVEGGGTSAGIKKFCEGVGKTPPTSQPRRAKSRRPNCAAAPITA